MPDRPAGLSAGGVTLGTEHIGPTAGTARKHTEMPHIARFERPQSLSRPVEVYRARQSSTRQWSGCHKVEARPEMDLNVGMPSSVPVAVCLGVASIWASLSLTPA